jgi:hypothetical protein
MSPFETQCVSQRITHLSSAFSNGESITSGKIYLFDLIEESHVTAKRITSELES